MKLNIRQGTKILIDPYATQKSILDEFFTKVHNASINDSYRAKKDVCLVVDTAHSIGHMTITHAKAGLNHPYKRVKMTTKEIDEQIHKKVQDMVNERYHILWISRHNLNTKAYKTLLSRFGEFSKIIPYDLRIIDINEILKVIKKEQQVNVIAAILPDTMFNELKDALSDTNISILKCVTEAVETNQNYSPTNSFTIKTRKYIKFKYFKDVKTNEIIQYLNDDKITI
jgi:polyhydroxyalkanoate synthesis regulator phasin